MLDAKIAGCSILWVPISVPGSVLAFETELDSQSGSISLARPLDYEKRREYTLQIRAQVKPVKTWNLLTLSF